jgi:hypothetical protein
MLDGFTDGKKNVTVTVNNPPLSGAYAGNANYVEVIISNRNRRTSCVCSVSIR